VWLRLESCRNEVGESFVFESGFFVTIPLLYRCVEVGMKVGSSCYDRSGKDVVGEGKDQYEVYTEREEEENRGSSLDINSRVTTRAGLGPTCRFISGLSKLSSLSAAYS
jgi:hypothetical protein